MFPSFVNSKAIPAGVISLTSPPSRASRRSSRFNNKRLSYVEDTVVNEISHKNRFRLRSSVIFDDNNTNPRPFSDVECGAYAKILLFTSRSKLLSRIFVCSLFQRECR